MICSNQATKLFCARKSFASASSARGPCDFGPLADLAISVFREVSEKRHASAISLPLPQDVPSPIPENCVRVQASLPPDFL